MVNLFDLNGEELILLCNLITLKIIENYTYREIGVISTFVSNLSSQLVMISVKGLYDDAINNHPEDTGNTAAPFNNTASHTSHF